MGSLRTGGESECNVVGIMCRFLPLSHSRTHQNSSPGPTAGIHRQARQRGVTVNERVLGCKKLYRFTLVCSQDSIPTKDRARLRSVSLLLLPPLLCPISLIPTSPFPSPSVPSLPPLPLRLAGGSTEDRAQKTERFDWCGSIRSLRRRCCRRAARRRSRCVRSTSSNA